MRLIVGSDHGGLALKNIVRDHLADLGHDVTDVGTHTDESTDYPDFGRLVAEMVARDEADLGIVVCGTGIGIGIAANKVKGIRAALCTNCFMARMARQHNDANVLCLGGRVLGDALALEIVDTFLRHDFEGGRHARRVKKIEEIES
ncbi:MAG: ribose 5-phosphate isomerase B [Candidatus Lernaella stagnicola]|nr:ribose 5-phosphate isomerase B [Candidatus Lernaella stagnicola]